MKQQKGGIKKDNRSDEDSIVGWRMEERKLSTGLPGYQEVGNI